MRWTPGWIPWSEHSTYSLGLQWQLAHLESVGLTKHVLAVRAGLAGYEPSDGSRFHVTRATDGRATVVADDSEPEPEPAYVADPQGPRSFTLDAPGRFAPVMASAPGR